MPENAVAIMPSQSAIQVSREWENQLDLIKKTVAPGLTNEEFALFCHVARVRHLDPLQRQIHAVKRNTWNSETNSYEQKMTIQTGIDGFRAIANRTDLYMPSERLPLIEGQGTPELRATVWVKKFSKQDGQWHEFGATAYYREFVQVKRNKTTGKLEPVSMWEKMGLGQTEKCAEAKVLRRGWPEELGQMYVDEEMQSQEIVPDLIQPNKQDKAKREVGKLKASAEPNRGHGNEGMEQKQEPVICAECRVADGHAPDCKLAPRPKVDPAEKWAKSPGHDPEKHISFKQGKMLFAIQKAHELDDPTVKEFLKEKLEIDHRYLIPKDRFQFVLDSLDPDHKHHEAKF